MNDRYSCGSFKDRKDSIQFWTGAAIDPVTKDLIHYIALRADAVSLGITPADSLVKSLDSALIGKGAKRVEVQRKLDK